MAVQQDVLAEVSVHIRMQFSSSRGWFEGGSHMQSSTYAGSPNQSLWVSLEHSVKVMELRREIMDVFRGLVPIYLPKQKEW